MSQQAPWATVYVDHVYRYKEHRGGWSAALRGPDAKALAFGRIPDIRLDRGKRDRANLQAGLTAILGGVWLAKKLIPNVQGVRVRSPFQDAIDVLIDRSSGGLRSDHPSAFIREYQARFADLSWKVEGLKLERYSTPFTKLIELAERGSGQEEKAVLERIEK